ncbi:hypothetical protein O6P43_005964 [Quillaja saponaria]|uniref:Uncharacterized protein n=1 Tax=Quillaja saponaria TaxID=32244 RepID=A0AAD7VHM5_QUISA|nr:hypothetical protein O6P43_005964 [Quillaja saponaria]
MAILLSSESYASESPSSEEQFSNKRLKSLEELFTKLLPVNLSLYELEIGGFLSHSIATELPPLMPIAETFLNSSRDAGERGRFFFEELPRMEEPAGSGSSCP